MAKSILIDKFHVTVLAPRGLPEAAYTAIRLTLDEARFRTRMERAVRDGYRVCVGGCQPMHPDDAGWLVWIPVLLALATVGVAWLALHR